MLIHQYVMEFNSNKVEEIYSQETSHTSNILSRNYNHQKVQNYAWYGMKYFVQVYSNIAIEVDIQ